jgi:hypothetical protein
LNPRILIPNLAATLFLTGLAWFLQTVQLPLLAHLREADFAESIRLQRRRNTILMAPAMLIELVTTVAITGALRPDWLTVSAAALVAVIWIVTFLFIAPINARLTKGFDARALQSLIRVNWIRTIAWTLRAVLVVTFALIANSET